MQKYKERQTPFLFCYDKAFPFGEGGTAIAVTEEGRPYGATAPFGRTSPAPLRGHPPQRGGLANNNLHHQMHL